MNEEKFFAEQFEASRDHLRAVAHRMLGSRSEADDAVQDAWLRVARTDVGAVDSLRNWLTTIVARICLDRLRTRRMRREEPIGPESEMVCSYDDAERHVLLSDSVGVAMMVVLNTLKPAERVAFVLHDMFGMQFDDIASIVGRSPAAARQLASRARRQVQNAPAEVEADRGRRRDLVAAFLAASREGDFAALLALLDPDVVLYADAAAIAAATAASWPDSSPLRPETRGASAVAATFKNRARAVQSVLAGGELGLVSGEPGLVYAPGGRPRVVFDFVIEEGWIVEISLIADHTIIQGLDLGV